MRTKKTDSAQTRPGEYTLASLWDGLVPDAIGLSLLAIMVASAAGVAWWSAHLAGRAVGRSQHAAGEAVARWVARDWSDALSGPDASIARLGLPDGLPVGVIRGVRLIDADGVALRTFARGPRGAALVAVEQAGASVDWPVSGRRIRAGLSGAAAAGRQVEVVLDPVSLGTFAWLVGGAAVVLGVALLLFLLLYRRLQRHVMPMDAVRRGLAALAAGLERDLATLSLSDSMGQVASSWNKLIEQVAALQNGAHATSEDVSTAAIERYQSRVLRGLLDRMPVGILRCRADEQIVYANSSCAQLLGASLESLAGQKLTDVVGEEIARPLVGAFVRGASAEPVDRQVGESEKLTTLRFRLLSGGGDEPGEREMVIMVEDVTHLREAEQARDNFLYHVTHELRTPLTNIHAYAETLARPDFDDEVTRKECYNVIISETRRLSNLVEDILSVSQLEVGSLRLELDDVDIVRLMRKVVQDNLGRADAKYIDLNLNLPAKAPRIRGDKQRLLILVNNLLGNAIKYTPEKGRVRLSLEVDEDALRIVVDDSGVGIAEEDQKHVFDKFYRAADESVQAVTGTGLGLAIAQEIARLHGGEIRLESVVGKGSTFTVELPVPKGAATS